MTKSQRIVLYVAFLALVWVLWSGHLKPLLLGFGALSCALVVLLMLRMDRQFPQERFWLRVLPRLPDFWLWLLVEVIKSNIHVARIVLSRRLDLAPEVVKIRALPPDRLGQAVLGNCITLTPGTVTLDDHEGELTVHCLTSHNALDLRQGGMNQRVAALTRW